MSSPPLGWLNQYWVMSGKVIWRLPLTVFQELSQTLEQRRAKKYFKTFRNKMVKTDAIEANSCELACPESFEILGSGFTRMQPDSPDHLLDFLNERVDFDGHHQRTLGYCWGHTSVTRNFNFLAYFDKENSAGIKIPTRQKKLRRFYKQIIKKIMKGKAQIIPGYSNLREFSSHPMIKNLLKTAVVKSWADQAVQSSSIPVFFNNFKRPMNYPKIYQRVGEIQDLLSLNITPKIHMSNQANPLFMHIISVYRVNKLDNGDIKLCILDNHQYEEGLKGCQTYLRVISPQNLKRLLVEYENSNQDEKHRPGPLYYPGWEEPHRNLTGWVREFNRTPEDLREIMRFARQRVKMCRQTHPFCQ